MASSGPLYDRARDAATLSQQGTPAGVATTPRSLVWRYPTSLRTSLYPNTSPATPATAATYSSRAPLVAQLHAMSTTTAAASPPPPRRTSLTRPASTTTTTTRRKHQLPRTSNPFEALSAPAFDAFIDNLTSTLRSVLEPPPPSTERTRGERRRERQDKSQVAQLERQDVFGQVVAVVDAAAAAAVDDEDQEKEEEEAGRVEGGEEPARLYVPFLCRRLLSRIAPFLLDPHACPALFSSLPSLQGRFRGDRARFSFF